MKDYDFDVYFPKLTSLEDCNLKQRKIEPQVFTPTNTLPDTVVEVLCDVYRKVVYVTRVLPYMYNEQCVEFKSDFIDDILGTVRVVAPEEKLVQACVTTCVEVDMFYLHLSSALEPVARHKSFSSVECEVHCDAIKTTSSGKTLTLLHKMSHLTEQWATNMREVVSLLEAETAFKRACVFAIEHDTTTGVVTPQEGLGEKLYEVTWKAVNEKPILQHSMAALHRDFCQTTCSFVKPSVSWISRVVALKQHKYRHLPSYTPRRMRNVQELE